MRLYLKKYALTLLFVYISVFAVLGSSALNNVVSFSAAAQQTFAMLLYLPFELMIIGKLLFDLKRFRLSGFNVLYYLFLMYYILLTVYRSCVGSEAQESFYYAVVLFGVLALYSLITEERFGPVHETLQANLLLIAGFFVAVKIFFTFIEGHLLTHLPINNLYSTSLLVLLMPFLIDMLRHGQNKRSKISCVLLALSVALVLVCGSRAIVMLSLAVLVTLLVLHIKNFAVVKKVLAGVAAALVLVFAAAATNVGTVRYSLVREFSVLSSVIPLENAFFNTEDPWEIIGAQDQIGRSDTMRAELMKKGLDQVWKSPFFGTGDLYYTYDLGYKTMEQTAHNFIIESIICFGLFGTLMVLLLLLAILKQCGFFGKPGTPNWRLRIYILVAMLYYFALGLVQPSVYNTLVCPMFLAVMAYYGERLLPAQQRQPKKVLCLLGCGKD